ncbi:SDR family oxidoreductase [Umezawaea tangerina]|uniref:Beta-ketoacyl synthase-like protein n=1 Tax=Umezawaea tangerina TaxID=84725 RepID=A0A2T0SVI9_9PSEU|nr:SDR family oxidoreductase [Umezawaea tangerina]PRY37434.1 beta-ketoacyl synthase-like protein [Umezawaea tangerina]
MRDLTGKLALVTGGARGVGKAIATELAARGAHVLVNYFHSHDAAKATKAEIEATGARVDLLRASIARSDQTTRLFEEIAQRYGRLDVLVNNAADGALVPVDEVTDDLLDRALDTNLKGALRCSRLAAPLMAGRGGSIVTVSALGGSQLVMANYLACAPAKAAAEAAMRYLAVEFAPLGIRVNTASAAMLVSDVADQFPDAAAMQRVIERSTPFGRLGTPAEFARVVAFLASDDAAWVTGQVILADGGLSLGAATLSPPKAAPAVEEPEVDDDTIAVVGMGMVVAGANGPDEFWRLRLDGAELFAPAPPDRWERANFHSADHAAEDKGYQDNGVFITDFTPTGADDADGELTTRWLRHSLEQALDGVTSRPEDRFSFHVGYTADGSQHLEEAGVLAAATSLSAEVLDGLALTDADRAEVLDGVAKTLGDRYRRGAHDPSRFLPHRVGALAMEGLLPEGTEVSMVDTACSSSLYAIDIGIKGLLMGRSDVAVCGGAFALAPRGTVLFAKLQGLSERGDVRSLDADADGVVFADGAAVVVLKKLGRAKADGDRVLAVVDAVGSSSDGKGKAVYAPNADGQDLAVRRALAGRVTGGEDVDWVLAHATGTPAGDLAEFTTLRRHFGTTRPTAVTSNKSLIGHTGWAAGVVSVIEAVLGLANDTIPPQHRFTAPPEEFRMADTGLEVPTGPRPWPRERGRPRTAAVSGFGFGGTNAHVLLRDHVPGEPPRTADRTDRKVVVVGWSGHVPGLSTPDEVARWLHGGPAPADGFGETYPAPPFAEVRLPASTVRTVDRCQLMALHCARDLRGQLGGLWDSGAERAGVVVGNLGPTRSAMLYATRCYLDDMAVALADHPAVAAAPEFTEALAARVRELVPPSNEDSFPGMMPNVVSARMANYFDLNGPNITLDSGLSSALTAFDVAHRYLVAGELDYALVGGFNGNALPEYRALLGDLVPADVPLAEGAFLFALTTEENAAAHGLPVLATLDVPGPEHRRAVDCGPSSPELARYAGAAGAVAVARALTGPAGPVSVVCDGVRVDLTVAAKPAADLPRRYVEPETPAEVSRFVPRLRESAARAVRPELPFFPPGTVVVTDHPELLDRVTVPDDTVVLSTRPLDRPRAGWHELTERTPLAVRTALAGSTARHLRLVADLGAVPTRAAVHAGDDRLTVLHEAAFLVVQERYSLLAEGGSFISLLLGARPDGRDHPCHGLFSALVKCSYHELPDCLVFGLFTADDDFATAVRRTERESASERLYPVVVLDPDGAGGTVRKTLELVPEAVELADPTTAMLSEDSVVLATGGARGITAEVVKELARAFRPTLYLLGSNPLDRYGPEVFEGTDEEFAAGRRHFIRSELAARRGALVAGLNREFDRMVDARAAHRNIAEMVEHCGAGRVTYLTCDVTDRAAVAAAVERVLAAHDRIDLVVNAAGRNRSALIPDKDFAEFRAIRDLKVDGYRNLKSALRDRPPAMWCNFGSLLGHFGLAGELDYGSGNDFLASAADHAATLSGTDEFTVGWTLWDGVGIGADVLARSYFKRGGLYTHMAITEGVQHFVRELHARNRHPFVLHMGDAELELGRRLYPGYLESGDTAPPSVHTAEFDPGALPDVGHHLVRGTPTVPASWVTELAAVAAARLVPDLEVVGFADLRFEHFVQATPAGPKRITARLLERGDEVTSVQVRITVDVVSPGGVRLVEDRLLSSVVVRFAREFPRAPHWEAWSDDDEVALPDPYHHDSSPVRLTGPFVATADTRWNPQGKRARFAPALPGPSSFTVPAVLLDAMVRTEVLALVDGRLPVAVPVSIRRIDLYQRANDHDLVRLHGDLEIHATPAESTIGRAAPGNRFVATTADGRVVAQIHDVEATALGYVDPRTAATTRA